MTIRIHDSSIFTAQGALIDVVTLARRRAGKRFNYMTANMPRRRVLFLRWQTSPAAGLPSEPFKVWRRPAIPLGTHQQIDFELINLFAVGKVIQFSEPMASVSLSVHPAVDGTVMVAPLCGPPQLESILSVQSRSLSSGGSATMEFHAAQITGLLLMNVGNFDNVTGVSLKNLDQVEAWELVETVGLPVDEGDWASTGQRHGIAQGRVGAEVSARDAAVERFRRGVNPFGWWPDFPDGTTAPPWEMPDPARLVDESALQLLPMLRQVATDAPDQQAARLFQFTVDPPRNPAGDSMPAAQPGNADLSPIGLLAMSVSSDPMLAVTLGYGTGYADVDIPSLELADHSFFSDPGRSDWDWLITGLWDKGLDGRSDAVEFAALVPRPARALPAPAPADLKVIFQAHLRPTRMDQSWLASIRASWERFPLMQLASVASFAAARHRTGSGGAAEALLQKRALTRGFRPIGNARNPHDPESTRQSATDGALSIPNNPGHVAASYAIATQNIFGIWSPWVADPINVTQPAPATVQFLSANLDAVDTGSGTRCPATLVFEISVDWRVRSVHRIELRGRLFAAATRHVDPPGGAAPAGLQKQLGAAPVSTSITFSGDVPSLAAGTVEALDSEGTAVVTPGDADQSSSRRYRVTVAGFSLDYAATPHVGLALDAQLIESIAPQRAGAWSPVTKVAYASDPRARPTTVVDIVTLASLPDAAGECHARIHWDVVPGALGYALYESTETRILSSHADFPEPTPARTLSERLTTIKQAFASAPLRRDFTRRNASLLTDTDVDVTLPRGSQDIHLYAVLPVMAGGTEGPWPSGEHADEALIPYAAPRIAVPAAPTIEVRQVREKSPALPDFRAYLRIGMRGNAGARPKRVDIYRVRVDDAARHLDSMGPPIVTLSASNAGWTLNPPDGGGNWIDNVTGFDRPSGSWRTVWYRAVAWSADDALRGVLKGRSPPSPAVSVLIPPAGPPDLSPLSISWPGGDPATVLVSFTSTAPVDPTPAGPHKLSVEATIAGGEALVQAMTSLDKLDTAQPASGSGVWRVDASPTRYRIVLRRASVDDVVSVIVQLIDPLGRISEQTITVPAGSLKPTLSPIEVVPVAAGGAIYTFSTNAPDTDDSGNAYRLQAELQPDPLTQPGCYLVHLLTGGGHGSGDTSPAGRFEPSGGIYRFAGPLSSVPMVAGWSDLESEQMMIGRQSPPQDDHFAIFSRTKLSSVLVQLQLPAGGNIEQRWHR